MINCRGRHIINYEFNDINSIIEVLHFTIRSSIFEIVLNSNNITSSWIKTKKTSYDFSQSSISSRYIFESWLLEWPVSISSDRICFRSCYESADIILYSCRIRISILISLSLYHWSSICRRSILISFSFV